MASTTVALEMANTHESDTQTEDLSAAERRSHRLALWLPAVAALLLFLPILGGEFVYDDLVLIRDNPNMHSGWTILSAFGTPFWELTPDSRRHGAGFYRPFGAVSFVLLWNLGGGDPAWFHAASWLLHAGVAAAVAALALALGWRPWIAAGAGLLFAWHGAHVEPVSWISALPDLMAALFSALALRAMWLKRMGWTVLWILCALLSKEAAIGTWLLCLGLALCSGPRRWSRLALLCAPAAVVVLLRMIAFDSIAAGFDKEVIRGTHFSFGERLGLSCSLLVRYLGFLAWPFPHAPFRPMRVDFDQIQTERTVQILIAAFVLLVSAAVWFYYAFARKHRNARNGLVLVALGLLFAGLLPVMNTRGLGQFPFEERFSYLASVGFSLLIPGALFALWQRRARAGAPPPSWMRVSLVGVFAALLGINAYSVVDSSRHWKDEESLFEWATEASPNAMLSWMSQGRLHLDAAQQMPVRTRERYELATKAEQSFTKALELSPDTWLITTVERENANVGLASSLWAQGDLNGAEQAFRQMLEQRYPDSVEGNAGLGTVLASQGQWFADRGQPEQALPKFEAAIPFLDVALAADDTQHGTHHTIGIAYGFLRQADLSAKHLARALELQPDNFMYAMDLVAANLERGRFFTARQILEAYLDRVPRSPRKGDAMAAIEQIKTYERILEQNPGMDPGELVEQIAEQERKLVAPRGG